VLNVYQTIRVLGRNDIKRISRDHFLLSMFAFVFLIANALRFGLPWLDRFLAGSGVLPNESNVNHFSDYFPLVLGFFVIFQGPLIAGAIFGFSLLDEKDDDTIKAMLVTPIPFESYVLFRVAIPTFIAFLVVLFEMLYIGQALVPFWTLVLLAIGSSLGAPIAALFYAVFAENKIQGFAMAKFVGITGWIVILGYFVSGPWQYAFGVFPPFWISLAYWQALDGNPYWWIALCIGTILQLGLLWSLAKAFHRVSFR